MKREALTERITMRARKDVVALIDRAARLVGISRSQFIRHCAQADAEIIIGSKPKKRKPHAT